MRLGVIPTRIAPVLWVKSHRGPLDLIYHKFDAKIGQGARKEESVAHVTGPSMRKGARFSG